MAVRGTERWSDMSKVILQITANLVIKQRFHQSYVSSLHYLPLLPLLGLAQFITRLASVCILLHEAAQLLNNPIHVATLALT